MTYIKTGRISINFRFHMGHRHRSPLWKSACLTHYQPTSFRLGLALYTMSSYIVFSMTFMSKITWEKFHADSFKWHAESKKCILIIWEMTSDTSMLFIRHLVRAGCLMYRLPFSCCFFNGRRPPKAPVRSLCVFLCKSFTMKYGPAFKHSLQHICICTVLDYLSCRSV